MLLEAEVPTWTQTAPTPAPRQRGASSCLWESLHLTSVWTLTEGPLENGGNFHFLSPSPQPGEASPPRVLLAGSSAKRRPGTWIQAVNRSAENTLCLLFPEKSPCGQHVLGGTSQGPSPVSKYGEKVSAGAWKRGPRSEAERSSGWRMSRGSGRERRASKPRRSSSLRAKRSQERAFKVQTILLPGTPAPAFPSAGCLHSSQCFSI